MKTIQTSADLHIDLLLLKKAALIFRAINHPLRQQMMQLLHTNLRMTVTEIYVTLRLEQSVASQHLAILRVAALVKAHRERKHIFYSVNYQRLKEVHHRAEELLQAPSI